MRRSIPPLFLALMSAQAAWAEDWRQIGIGTAPGAVTSLYVELQTIRRDGVIRYAWILAGLDRARSAYQYKKELIAIDRLRNQFEGIKWVWIDAAGRITENNDPDLRWKGPSSSRIPSFR